MKDVLELQKLSSEDSMGGQVAVEKTPTTTVTLTTLWSTVSNSC